MSIYDKASLVLIPSGTKTSKVYSQKPTNGDGDFTFSRSTAATRVNASGNIEKETSNLLLQSNQFDTTWVKVNTTLTSGQAGYDGTNDAWLVDKSAASARIEQYVSASGVQTLSAYVKAGTLNWTRLNVDTDWAYYDLANGVVGTATGSNIIDHSIEDAGGGWYRCVLVVNRSITTARIYPADADNNSGGTSGNIYIQDAQLEQGLVARNVITTTTTAIYGGITDNVPRLDYTDSSCPALLLEPQRTNQVENSEYYESYAFSRASISSNATASPEGLLNASELVEDSTNENHFFRIPNLSWTSGTDVVFSIYLKENTRRYARLRFDATGGNTRAWLDLRTGETTFIDNTDNPVCTSTDVGNGWFRYEFKVTPSNTSAAGSVQIFTQSVESVTGSLQTTYQGDGSSGIYVWGAQVETGSYPTSYIPTYGSGAVTRNFDQAFSDQFQSKGIISSTQGTIFFDVKEIYGTAVQWNIQNQGSLEYALRVQFRADGAIWYQKTPAAQTTIRSITGLTPSRYKIAMSWNGTNLISSFNGTSYIDTIDASIASQLNQIIRPNVNNVSVATNKILVFPTQLTEAELNALTTI